MARLIQGPVALALATESHAQAAPSPAKGELIAQSGG